MKRISLLLSVLIMISLLLSSCSIFAPKPDKDVLYVNLTWHQHQPLYKRMRMELHTPWVRVHATQGLL
jgi:outer membrane biogenesis lipoprotein LolB